MVKPCPRMVCITGCTSAAVNAKSGATAVCPPARGSNATVDASPVSDWVGTPPRVKLFWRGLVTVTTPSLPTMASPPRAWPSAAESSGVLGCIGIGIGIVCGSGVAVALTAAAAD